MREDEFRRRYQYTEDRDNYKANGDRTERNRSKSQEFKAPRGSAHRAHKKRGKNGLKTKIISSVAAALAISAVVSVYTKTQDKPEPIQATDLIEEQADVSKLGLTEETMQQLIEMNAYFENVDLLDVSPNDLVQKSNEMSQLIEQCIREKMAYAAGDKYKAEDFKISLGHIVSSDLETVASIRAEADYLERKAGISFRGDDSMFTSDTMPKEMFEMIKLAKETLPELNDRIRSDNMLERISVKNALAELKQHFDELDHFNTNKLRIITKENKFAIFNETTNEISLVSYEQQMENSQIKVADKDEEERG